MKVAVVSRYGVLPRFEMPVLLGVFSDGNEARYIDDLTLQENQRVKVEVFELDAGLPGAGRVDPDNATTASGADDPVVPSPACFIADDIEC